MIRYLVDDAREQRPIGTAPFHRYVLDDDTVWTEFHRLPSGYLLRFPGLADFEVSQDGQTVIAHPTAEADPATVEHLYLTQLYPLALSRQGRPAFHASVVTAPGGCIAFLGQSGKGKSTLAAAFALAEDAFLTDDALIVEDSEGPVLAIPGHASLRLWEDSVEALVRPGTTRAGRIGYSDKARLLAGEALPHCTGPRRLLAAYVLQDAGTVEVSIQPLAGAERQLAWIRNSFLLDITDRDLLARHFEWTHRVASKVPTFALDYPRDYGMLPEVRGALLRHARELGE